jgi:hypothetical protein
MVCNYSKHHGTMLVRQRDNNTIHFNVYLSYRSQLKAYSKQLFDPFRRRERINFFFGPETSIETTIGQLNFFRWLIQNDILPFIEENITVIEADMLSTQKKNTQKRSCEQVKKKRKEISRSYVHSVSKYQGTHRITFD